MYGISQNPDTKDYIMVLQDGLCSKCSKIYTDISSKWCKPCQINNLKTEFTDWTSGNERIDDFIQEMQLKIDKYDDDIIEWIPYNQFNDIKEIAKDDFAIYSARWKDDPFCYDSNKKELKRESDKMVTLHSSNGLFREFLEV